MVNIDISPVCVAKMREEYPELSFLEMDMTRLSFPDNSFDLVVEKATLDSLLVDAKSPWNLNSPGHTLVSKALRSVHYEMLWRILLPLKILKCALISIVREVKRVLKPSGLFLSITFSQPHHRWLIDTLIDHPWCQTPFSSSYWTKLIFLLLGCHYWLSLVWTGVWLLINCLAPLTTTSLPWKKEGRRARGRLWVGTEAAHTLNWLAGFCLVFHELSMLGLNSPSQVGYWRGAKSRLV